MFDCFTQQLGKKRVKVKLDSRLLGTFRRNLSIQNNNEITIEIDLLKLIVAIGTINTRRYNPTERNKFLDECDLLESIRTRQDEFMIKIFPDAQIQATISEDLGIGLSVLITDYLYEIDWSTLSKIKLSGQQSGADITCLTKSGQTIVIEAKGTTNEYTRTSQKKDALGQKVMHPADFNLASCSLLKDNNISDVDFLDPPEVNKNRKFDRGILMADHYTRMFNFIGQRELSRYFNLMRKRIKNDIRSYEVNEKENLYDRIKKDYIKIRKMGKTFFGNLEKTNEDDFIFLGIDKNLISFRGFLNFKRYEKDSYLKLKNNNFFITSDGVCFANLRDINFIQEQLKDKEIRHYQDSITILDVDSMSHNSLNKFVARLFRELGCKVELETILQKHSARPMVADQIVEYEGKRIIIEIKKSLTAHSLRYIEKMRNRMEDSDIYKFIVITPDRLRNNNILKYGKTMDLVLIDRDVLKKILKKPHVLIDYLTS